MSVLVTTDDGCHRLSPRGERTTSFAGHRVEGLAPGPDGALLAIVDQRAIWSYDRDCQWSPVATSTATLTAVAAIGDTVFVGTSDARVLRLGPRGSLAPLPGFDSVRGRDEWHSVGMPLRVRSMTTTADGGALLVNVHVGGIPRSTDLGATWAPSLAVDADVHQVLAHPTRPEVVVAAAAVGLCRSTDAGATWSITDDGLAMTYARGVAIVGDDVLVTVSDGPWSDRSAVYRAPVDGGRASLVEGGLPERLHGNIDSGCIASDGARIALVDGDGDLWVSTQGGDGFERVVEGWPDVTGLAFP